MFKRTAVALYVVAVLACFGAAQEKSGIAGWSEQQIAKLPPSEKPVRLFNGSNLTGWEGQIGKYFSAQDGIIVAKNGEEDAPKASTYLVTQRKYRNFRLIFESKLVASEMHSGIALWGKTVENEGDPYSYQGHLVMFPSNYGYYDLYRRNSIYRDRDGVAKRAGKQHDWNQMEILAIGNRIRHVINGTPVADWSDPQPELCQSGPLGLQLHSNRVPQEVHFRGLILTEDPEDRLVTVTDRGAAEPSGSAGLVGGLDSSKLGLIPPKMRQFVAEKKIAGAVTLVARKKGIVHLEAVGQADIENKVPMSKDTIFGIASMTKPITATAIMILQDEDKLSIDDPVSKYVPQFKEASLASGPPQREITIRDLMTHTSGLIGSQQNEGSLKETVEQMAKRPLGFEPGSKWQYSPGLTVCGRIIEVASGQPYEQFLAQRIFQPLKMVDTTFHPSLAQQERLARLYQPSKDKESLEVASHWLIELSDNRTPNPSGGLFSTANDMARFYQMVLSGGQLDGQRIVSEAAVREMTTIQTGGLETGFTPGNGWGLGWCVVRQPQEVTQTLSPGTYGHGGAFGTQGWVDPKRDMILVLMIQRTGFGNSDGSEIRRAFQQIAVSALRR